MIKKIVSISILLLGTLQLTHAGGESVFNKRTRGTQKRPKAQSAAERKKNLQKLHLALDKLEEKLQKIRDQKKEDSLVKQLEKISLEPSIPVSNQPTAPDAESTTIEEERLRNTVRPENVMPFIMFGEQPQTPYPTRQSSPITALAPEQTFTTLSDLHAAQRAIASTTIPQQSDSTKQDWQLRYTGDDLEDQYQSVTPPTAHPIHRTSYKEKNPCPSTSSGCTGLSNYSSLNCHLLSQKQLQQTGYDYFNEPMGP